MRSVGRYIVYGEIASGGMASIHLGCLPGPFSFNRTVAVKELHRHLVAEPSARAMFVEEARLASSIRHPNVVSVLDVVHEGDDVFLVLEYVHGESLSRALTGSIARNEQIPSEVVAAIVIDSLRGLHAAHELRDASGELLNLVHRDVSPQNILIGVDGSARLVDFGIAKARDRIFFTQGAELRGKLPYMAPEQLRDEPVDRRADIWAAGVVLWEALTGRRLFAADNPGATIQKILAPSPPPPPSSVRPELARFDALLRRTFMLDPEARTPTAQALADELETACPPAPATAVSRWLERVASDALARRQALEREMQIAIRRAGPVNVPAAAPVAEGARHGAVDAELATALGVARSLAPGPGAPSLQRDDGFEPGIEQLRKPRRRARWLLVGAGLVFAAVLSGRALPSRRSRVADPPAPAPAPAPSATPLAASPSEMATAPRVELPAGRTASSASSSRPRPTRVPSRDRVREREASESPGVTASPPALAPAAASVPTDCASPYTIGPPPDFIKRPKPECF